MNNLNITLDGQLGEILGCLLGNSVWVGPGRGIAPGRSRFLLRKLQLPRRKEPFGKPELEFHSNNVNLSMDVISLFGSVYIKCR